MVDIRGSIRVILALIELEVRRVMHDRTELYFRAVQPLLWLVVFGYIMNSLHAIPTGNIPYIDFILPGVIIQSATSVAIFFGLIIIWERESGILKKLIAAPCPRFAIVVGRAMAAGVRALFQVVIIIPFALLLGVKIILNPFYLFAALVIVFISAAGFAGLSIWIASILKTRERFMGIGQAITFPLFFASNALYPISAMPTILQWFSTINPMTYMVSATRSLLITGDLSTLFIDVVAIVAFDLAIFWLAARDFRQVIN
jgi:ABC-2 type transport system permease protein